MALKKTCRCGTLIDYGIDMCDVCRADKTKEKKANNKQYDVYTRNTDATRFYHSREWITVSNVVRLKFNGMCARCWINIAEVVASNVVHHIVELSADWDKRLEINNLVCLCHGCHNEIHGYIDRGDKVRVERELRVIVAEWI